ncbi:MAG: SH3 domain-containing protein [Anaerolineaceae bacterium]|nr:SH3 domain-containing protein [Anaerolineaceae bacterium]
MDSILKRKFYLPVAIFISLGFALFINPSSSSLAQAPTVDIPTVTSSPSGILATVKENADQSQINVRSGPATFYDKVGVLLVNQQVPAKGRSAGGDWILVDYPGAPGGVAWVYAPLVGLTPGTLPVVAPPPTPTPLATSTIDPTLAAQFVITIEPTRLPTFTEPPPLVIPTFPAGGSAGTSGGVPMGLVIIGLASLGILIGIFTLAQGR